MIKTVKCDKMAEINHTLTFIIESNKQIGSCEGDDEMKKISMQFILRIIAIVVFIGGAFIGYDVGDKMVTINQVVSYQFSFVEALIVWFISFAIGVLFLAIAKIIDLLEGQ